MLHNSIVSLAGMWHVEAAFIILTALLNITCQCNFNFALEVARLRHVDDEHKILISKQCSRIIFPLLTQIMAIGNGQLKKYVVFIQK